MKNLSDHFGSHNLLACVVLQPAVPLCAPYMVPDNFDFLIPKIGYVKKSLFLYVAHSLKLIQLISSQFRIHEIEEKGILLILLFKVVRR